VRKGNDIVVPQPTCGYVLKKDYVDYVGGDDAEPRRRANTYDAAEYLMKVHKGEGTSARHRLHRRRARDTVTYHTPCHLKAQNIGLKSRDLIKLTGAKVKLVQQCSGIDGMWGLRAENTDISIPDRRKLATRSARPAATWWPATATWPTPPSPSRPARTRCTRCSSSPVPTASPRRPTRPPAEPLTTRHHPQTPRKLTLDDIADASRLRARARGAARARHRAQAPSPGRSAPSSR
jgi:hypothetical protein